MKFELFCSLTGSMPEKLQLRFVGFYFSPDKKLKQARQLQQTVNAAGFKCFGTPQFEC